MVGIGAERGDLQPVAVLTHADRAEFDAGIPQRVGPRPQQLLHLLGPRVGGEVQITAEPAEQRVAHIAADEVQLMPRVSEYPSEFAQHRAVPVQRNLCTGKQSAISSIVRHVRTAKCQTTITRPQAALRSLTITRMCNGSV